MKISKNKIAAIAVTLLLTLSTVSMMLMPNAHAAYNIPVYAYINAEPNPVGVGQQVEIIMWVQVIFGANAALTNTFRFSNPPQTPSWTLVITAPDGTNTTNTLGVVQSPTSDYDDFFTPTTVGTYTLTFNFPATTVTSSNDPTSTLINDTYTAASASTTITVQQAAITPLPQTPLPTAYWTRPIYGENSAWYLLGSNWLGFSSPGFQAIGGGTNLGGNGALFGSTDNVGPLTSHIMWTMPLQSGGVVGGTTFPIAGNTYFEGSAYDQRFTNPIIVDGLLIFRMPYSTTIPSGGPTVCINLQTGKTQWSGAGVQTPNNPVPAISFAYVYDAEDPNQHGIWQPMLVASVSGQWNFYDAFTGNLLFNMTSPPSGTTMLGPSGEYLAVRLVNYGNTTNPNWYMQQWNSSRLWDNDYSGPSTTPVIPPPITNGADPSLYDFNVSVPWLNTQTLNGAAVTSYTINAAIQGDILLARAGNFPSAGENSFFGALSWTPYTFYGINLNTTSGTLGTELWSNTIQPPPNNITVLWAGIDPINNVFVENYRETNNFVGFSLITGQQVWGPTPSQPPLDYYGSDASGSISDTVAYGHIYSSAYAGILYCYDTKTGNVLWTFGNGGVGNTTDSGVETPFGHYPTFVNAVGSGVIYTVTTEHTEETPVFKGALARAINATTGQQIWTLSDYTGEFTTNSYAIADGFAVMFNGYDNQIYTVGRGPSALTVTASPAVTAFGDNVVIRGTVTDVSAGTTQTQQAGDFPNGVPVSSDASMGDWMGYVYQQQPLPADFTGVPVAVAVTDSNGNCYNIGTATTDATGMYSLTWTPTIPGNFTVTATFAGTKGYWPSTGETTFNIMSAPSTTTAAPTPTPTSVADMYFVPAIAGLFVLIIVVAIVLAVLVLRKRP